MSRRGARGKDGPRTIPSPEIRRDIARRVAQSARPGDAQVSNSTATRLGVNRSTVWRWLNKPQRQPGRPRANRSLEDEIRGVYYEQGGNVARTHRILVDSGQIDCSLRTFYRQIEAIPAPERVYALEGSAAMRHQTTTVLPIIAAHRNQRWQIDHRELDLFVIPPPPGEKPVRPWITSIIDDATRVIPGYALSLEPNSTVVAQALAAAISEHPLGSNPFGGVPSELLVDNGADFMSEHITQIAERLGIAVVPCYPYVPQHKGKIERWHRTMDQLLLTGLPGDTKGPRVLNGDLRTDGRAPLLFEELPGLIEQLLATYHDRKHAGLGVTPREAWNADMTLTRALEPAELGPLLLREDTRVVAREGVHVQVFRTSQYYTAPALATRRGATVRIGYLPHDDRQVWVYEPNGELICIAMPARRLGDDERLAFVRHRQREVADFRDAARRARTAGRANHEALVASDQDSKIIGLPAPDHPSVRPRRSAPDTKPPSADIIEIAFGAPPPPEES